MQHSIPPCLLEGWRARFQRTGAKQYGGDRYRYVRYRNACAGSGWAGRVELDRLSRIGGGAASCGLQPTAFGRLVRDELLYA